MKYSKMDNFDLTKFEEEIAKFIGRKYAIQIGTGTAALSIALMSLGIGKGDEVIIPSLVCYSVPFAVLFAGAKPKFADVDMLTYNISPKSVYSLINKNTKAIIAVHLFGYPCDIYELDKLAKNNKIYLIEDFAQGFGGKYNDTNLGSFGIISVTSFGKDKIIDAGGGGVLFTDEREIAERSRHLIKYLLNRNNFKLLWNKMIYKIIMGGLKSFDRGSIRFRKVISNIYNYFWPLYFYKFQDGNEKKIKEKLKYLKKELRIRYENASLLREILSHPYILHPDYVMNPEIAFMNYTIILKEIKYSSLYKFCLFSKTKDYYPPMHKIFEDKATLLATEELSDHLINFPVSSKYLLSDIYAIANRILKKISFVM